jgi:hypothetical protein
MLRDPSQRLISAFHHGRHCNLDCNPENGFGNLSCSTVRGQKRASDGCIQPSMDGQQYPTEATYAASPQVQGCAAKMLVGRSCNAREPVTDQEVVQASRRLAAFGFVGIVEEWNLSICLFHRLFGGVPNPVEGEAVRVGQTSPASAGSLYSTAVLEGARDGADAAVYADAVLRFRQDVNQVLADLTGNAPQYQQSGEQDEGHAAVVDRQVKRGGVDRGRPPVIWLHVHKAGGTLICGMAQKMGERVPPSKAKMCNAKDDEQSGDGTKGLRYLGRERWSCTERFDAYQTGTECLGAHGGRSCTWGQIEREVEPEIELECPQFAYGTTVREPMELLASNINFHHDIGVHHVAVIRWLRSVVAARNAGKAPPACTKKRGCQLHPRLAFLPYDNPVTRYLNGRVGWTVPPTQLSHVHFEAATAALSKFAVVVRLSALAADAVQFTASFGWPRDKVLAVLHHSTTAERGATNGTAATVQGKHTNHSIELGDDESFLRQLNLWDLKLYAHACQLAAARTQAAQQLVMGGRTDNGADTMFGQVD